MKSGRQIHPILIAASPILFLFSHNLGLVSVGQLAWPISIAVLFALSIWGLLILVTRDRLKAGILASIVLVFVVGYGSLFDLFSGIAIAGRDLGQHKYVFPVWTALLLFSVFLVVMIKMDLTAIAASLNVGAGVLVLVPIATVALQLAEPNPDTAITSSRPLELAVSGYSPDIYYVFLDGCAREDVLEEIYGIETSEFNEFLQRRGFFIANRSHSNYSQTYLSAASSLNFDYLENLIDLVGTDSDDRQPLRQLIQDSRIVRELRDEGYILISFATGMDYTEIKGADIYLSNRWSLNEFHNTLLNMTPIPGLLNRVLSTSSDFQYDSHRSRILYTLQHLGEVAKMEEPTITFAHILACHPPFVFTDVGDERNPPRDYSLADGNFFMLQANQEEYVEDYGSQFLFISSELQRSVDEILENSAEPPIIILQGDHGGGSELNFSSLQETNITERMSIMNAYYLPDGGNGWLYNEISPVNTFRVLLNYYFEADLPLLEDAHYFSTIEKPYQLTNVSEVLTSH